MSNAHASKHHGFHEIKRREPKSTQRKRKNKAKANARKTERRKVLLGA